jgi:hypothetical protein
VEDRRNSPRMGRKYYMPNIKNADQLDCNNYRRIRLLNKAYQIFCNLLYERLQPHTEHTLGLGQNIRFRSDTHNMTLKYNITINIQIYMVRI